MTDEQYLGEALALLLMKSKWRFETGLHLREIDNFYKEMGGGANAGQYDKACAELGGILLEIFREGDIKVERF